MSDAERRLFVLRHAKSDWGTGEDDHARPLAPRGVRATVRLRAVLASWEERVDLVLCSSAVRAQQTLEGIRGGLPDDVEVRVEPTLYGAGPGDVLAHVRTVPDHVGGVLVVGHNPTMESIVRGLVGDGPTWALDRLAGGYPTGGLARLRTEVAWAELGWGTCTLEDLVVPRELPDPDV